MKNFILCCFILIISCDSKNSEEPQKGSPEVILDSENAQKIAALPLQCISQEFPNKLSQTLSAETDMGTPTELHPAFYGCFDWHSAVHGHWSLVYLAKHFPDLDQKDSISQKLLQHISPQNIQKEMEYFNRKQEYSYERTYGWAWLLKLQQELDSWNTESGKELSRNLQPLTDVLVERHKTYLPKLAYPIRVGTHSNTAFGLSFAYDYAQSVNDTVFVDLIENRAKDFYAKDENCPYEWEPSGYDFLSPCLEEIDLMRKVLRKEEFKTWLYHFMPQLSQPNFEWEPGKIIDRTDGHLVHLDGLNFSRAWVLYGLAQQYPEFNHLVPLADQHFNQSFPSLVGDAYEGGHWLGSFALYALDQAENLKP